MDKKDGACCGWYDTAVQRVGVPLCQQPILERSLNGSSACVWCVREVCRTPLWTLKLIQKKLHGCSKVSFISYVEDQGNSLDQFRMVVTMRRRCVYRTRVPALWHEHRKPSDTISDYICLQNGNEACKFTYLHHTSKGNLCVAQFKVQGGSNMTGTNCD